MAERIYASWIPDEEVARARAILAARGELSEQDRAPDWLLPQKSAPKMTLEMVSFSDAYAQLFGGQR
jgi:hypothetical protein